MFASLADYRYLLLSFRLKIVNWRRRSMARFIYTSADSHSHMVVYSKRNAENSTFKYTKQFHTAPTLGTKVRFIKKRSLLIFDTHRNRTYTDERTYPKLNLVRYYKKENQKVNLGASGTWRNSDTVGVPEFGSRASATSTPNFARFRRIIYYSVPSILMGRPSVLAAGRTLALQLDPIKPDALNSIVSDACLRTHTVNQA